MSRHTFVFFFLLVCFNSAKPSLSLFGYSAVVRTPVLSPQAMQRYRKFSSHGHHRSLLGIPPARLQPQKTTYLTPLQKKVWIFYRQDIKRLAFSESTRPKGQVIGWASTLQENGATRENGLYNQLIAKGGKRRKVSSRRVSEKRFLDCASLGSE